MQKKRSAEESDKDSADDAIDKDTLPHRIEGA